MKCKKCGIEFEAQSGNGRPQGYCGVGCRRAMEYEIRRINVRLAELERVQQSVRVAIARGDTMMILGWGHPQEAALLVAAEIAREETRLKELLGASQ